VHFLTPYNTIHDGQWMMLSKAWGVKSRNIVETGTSDLSPFHIKHLEVSGQFIFREICRLTTLGIC